MCAESLASSEVNNQIDSNTEYVLDVIDQLCKKYDYRLVVDKHNGKLYVESNVTHNSTCDFYLRFFIDRWSEKTIVWSDYSLSFRLFVDSAELKHCFNSGVDMTNQVVNFMREVESQLSVLPF